MTARRLPASHGPRLIAALKQGLPVTVLDALRDEWQLPQDRLLALAGISTRTLFRRRKTGRLDPRESDQVIRLVTVLDAAESLFEGDREAARHWLLRPVKGLGDVAPVELLDSEGRDHIPLFLVDDPE
jgi:putative toxin-antitoxin system antitoxin component (TIGR02293 family)